VTSESRWRFLPPACLALAWALNHSALSTLRPHSWGFWFGCETKLEPVVRVLFHRTLRPTWRWHCEGRDGGNGLSFKEQPVDADERHPHRLAEESKTWEVCHGDMGQYHRQAEG
jgi:hypothetical protein